MEKPGKMMGIMVAMVLAAGLGTSFAQESAASADRVAGQEVEVLSSHVIDIGQRKMIMRRIKAPELQERPAAVAPEPAPSRKQIEELPAFQESRRRYEKAYFAPFVDARAITDTGISELRWRDEQGEYVVWTTLDAAHLTVMSWVETDHSYFSFFGSVTTETVAEIQRWNAEIDAYRGPEAAKKTIPTLGPVSRDKSYYQFVERPADEGTLSEADRFMEDLHGYYDAHRKEIARKYEQMETERIAREEYLRLHPPVPKDTVINWFPIRGGNP